MSSHLHLLQTEDADSNGNGLITPTGSIEGTETWTWRVMGLFASAEMDPGAV